ncbi:MAG: hypothetical protein QME14_01795 [Methanobacteriaceae archaeon]|nr:hypothetical protein [Methanobacteriaceae archaeon]
MDLSRQELMELQEQLVIVYKLISQHRLMKKFYYNGVEFDDPFIDNSELIQEFMEIENPEQILKGSIMEIEKINNPELGDDIDFCRILDSFDLDLLKYKYRIEKPSDIDNLNIKSLINHV